MIDTQIQFQIMILTDVVSWKNDKKDYNIKQKVNMKKYLILGVFKIENSQEIETKTIPAITTNTIWVLENIIHELLFLGGVGSLIE